MILHLKQPWDNYINYTFLSNRCQERETLTPGNTSYPLRRHSPKERRRIEETELRRPCSLDPADATELGLTLKVNPLASVFMRDTFVDNGCFL